MKTKPNPKKNAKPLSASDAQELEQSLAVELRRLKKAAGKAHQMYESEQDPLMAEAYLQNWLKISRDIANMAKVQPKADAEAGELLSKSDVEAVWSRTMAEFRAALDKLPRRLSTNPVFANCDLVAVELAVEKETKELMRHLQGS